MVELNLHGTNYIGCNPSNIGNDIFYAINPQNGEKSKLGFYEATGNEVNAACDLANNAFCNYKILSNNEKARFLEVISEEIMNLGDQLLEIADWETALGLSRLKNERKRTCDQIMMFADYIKNGDHEENIIDDKDSQTVLKRMLIPIGPVSVFGVSNFPFAFGVCGGDSISALAAGCSVVVKGHPSHPQTSELFALAMKKAIERKGLPNGIFSLLQGKKNEIGKKLVLHPFIQAVGFTGSLQGGRSLFDFAASRKNPVPVYAEMGSINPVFITQSALNSRSDEMAEQFAGSITIGAGQFCTKPGVFFLPSSKEGKHFIEKTVELMKSKDDQSLLNKGIYESIVNAMKETYILDKVEVLMGGESANKHFSFRNTILKTDFPTFLKEPRLKMEYFGPLALFVECDSEEQFLVALDQLGGQLTGTIHLEKDDYEKIKPLFKKLNDKVGRVIINGVPTGVKVSSAMNHGGPYPASTFVCYTSVGMTAIKRFLRPICYQNVPNELL